jgi:hypothetical protein
MQERPRLGRTIERVGLILGALLVIYFRPFAHLFGGVDAQERMYGAWLEVAIFCAAWALAKTIYLFGFRRNEQRLEMAAIKEEVRSGRMKRMPLLTRAALLIGMLALLGLGSRATEPYRSQILHFAVPLFLILAGIELDHILRPGNSELPYPKDELVMFFRARMLTAGYVTAILALAGIYVVSLLSLQYIAYLLPVGITLSLLVPAYLYCRLDRSAGVNE